jgi:CelD/BcsL family acetyltransferase involved in cellulose biosynthesis
VTGCWLEKRVGLKFFLGEIPLFSIHFPLLVLDAHFTELEASPDELEMILKELAASVEGILIRSQPIREKLPRLSLLADSIRYVPAQYERFYVDLQGSFSDYLDKFSSKSRSTLRRKVKKFGEFCGGQLDWREFRNSEDMDDFHRLAREVSKKTYQERLLDAGLPDDEEFRQQMHALARQDRARGYILFHDAKPIAYLFCSMRQGGIMINRYLGYNPEFQSWSPGTMLHYLVLEKLFTEGGLRMFDFTEGEGTQKRFFATGSARCADVYHFRRTAKNYLILCLHAATDFSSTSAVRVLDKLGLKARVKKFFRSSA